jgi:hypothetical protein
VLEIERLSWLKPRYAVRDDRGHTGMWMRRRFKENMTGDLDGHPYELGRDGRKHFFLAQAGSVLATADAGRRGSWAISVGGSAYELRRKSAWRSEMELQGGPTSIGSIRKAKAPRGKVLCELPLELSPAVQAFIGFLVVTLWNRAAASSGATTAAVTGSGS